MNAGPRKGQTRAGPRARPSSERRAASGDRRLAGKDVLDGRPRPPSNWRGRAHRSLEGRIEGPVHAPTPRTSTRILSASSPPRACSRPSTSTNSGPPNGCAPVTRSRAPGRMPALGEVAEHLGVASRRPARRSRPAPARAWRARSSGRRPGRAPRWGSGRRGGRASGCRACRRSGARAPPRCSARAPRPRRGRGPRACRAPRRGRPRSGGDGGSPRAPPARRPG